MWSCRKNLLRFLCRLHVDAKIMWSCRQKTVYVFYRRRIPGTLVWPRQGIGDACHIDACHLFNISFRPINTAASLIMIMPYIVKWCSGVVCTPVGDYVFIGGCCLVSFLKEIVHVVNETAIIIQRTN